MKHHSILLFGVTGSTVPILLLLQQLGGISPRLHPIDVYTLFLGVSGFALYINNMTLDGGWWSSLRRRFKLHTFRLTVFASALCLNYWLLHNFNTLQWPYLWPRPGVFILLLMAILVVWFYEEMQQVWIFRLVGVFMLVIGQSYLLHSIETTIVDFNFVSGLHLFGVAGIISVMFLNFVNQFTPQSRQGNPGPPTRPPVVAAVIPTYNEPITILERTIQSLKALEYPDKLLHIIISDDGLSQRCPGPGPTLWSSLQPRRTA